MRHGEEEPIVSSEERRVRPGGLSVTVSTIKTIRDGDHRPPLIEDLKIRLRQIRHGAPVAVFHDDIQGDPRDT